MRLLDRFRRDPSTSHPAYDAANTRRVYPVMPRHLDPSRRTASPDPQTTLWTIPQGLALAPSAIAIRVTENEAAREMRIAALVDQWQSEASATPEVVESWGRIADMTAQLQRLVSVLSITRESVSA